MDCADVAKLMILRWGDSLDVWEALCHCRVLLRRTQECWSDSRRGMCRWEQRLEGRGEGALSHGCRQPPEAGTGPKEVIPRGSAHSTVLKASWGSRRWVWLFQKTMVKHFRTAGVRGHASESSPRKFWGSQVPRG